MRACSSSVPVESRTTSDCQEPTRTLRVGAIQIESQPGRIEANHARATAMIEEAARSGAELVVLPELFACGYVPNKVIWDYAEPLAGPTATWLCETSRRLGVYLGAGMTETDGTDFFNAYLITAPDGEIAGHIRKTMAEAYCFKRSEGSHIEVEFVESGQTHVLAAGDFCLVEQGERFSYRNVSDERARLCLLHTPSFDTESEVLG